MPEMIVISPTANMAARMLRVAAYCRVSSDSDDQLESFAAQVEYYTQLVNDNATWELVDIYADEGLTGTRSDTRPEFQRLLSDCRKGKIDKVFAKSISRFARNTRDCLISIRELKTLGVEIFFEKERLDTGDLAGELLFGFFGSLSQMESVSISGNMRWSYQRRMQSGRFVTNTAPYGYRLVSGNLIVHEYEAKVVQFIFKSYLSGVGMCTIADELLRANLPNKCGNMHWAHSTLQDILNNEKYIGDALVQKWFITDCFPPIHKRNHGEREQYYIENNHAAIVSKEVFEMAKLLREKRSLCVQGSAPQVYPFSRRITCGECGRTFKRKVCRGKTYWVCRGHFTDKESCSVKQLPEPAVMAAFVRLWNKLRQNRHEILYPMIEQLDSLQSHASKRNAKLYELDLQIDSRIQQNHALNHLRSQGLIDDTLYIESVNEVRNDISALRRERRRLIDGRDDEIISATKCLIEILKSGPKVMQAFEVSLFDGIVENIIALSQTEVRFRLINGLEVTEAVERIGR